MRVEAHTQIGERIADPTAERLLGSDDHHAYG